ncbi:hypothetical protein G4G93_03725 [Methylobacterium sp. DB0501]|nr:hypothetical protein [Methylobacterium sp. DB0501]
MPFVKTLSVGHGDMFYISHASDNFTIIDCHLQEHNKAALLAQVWTEASKKGCVRFISTHPDEDHIAGLKDLDEVLSLQNFYCVTNKATKDDPSVSFKHYCMLRDGPKAFHISQGCTRKWMNEADATRGSAGLSILWPRLNNPHFIDAWVDAKHGLAFNNLSTVVQYNAANGVKMLWLGDLETAFMEAITDEVPLEKVHIIFASHHGRKSGKIPNAWLDKLDPNIIVIGEAPSRHLHYYRGYRKLTQAKAGHITFDLTDANKVHIYASELAYIPENCPLDWEGQTRFDALYYTGTLNI